MMNSFAQAAYSPSTLALSQVASSGIKSPRATYLETLKKMYAGISPKEFSSLAVQTIKIYGMTVQVKDAWDKGAAFIPAEKERKLVVMYNAFINGVSGPAEQRPFIVDYKFINKLPEVVVRAIKKLSDIHAQSRKRKGQNGNTVLGRNIPHYVSGTALGILASALGLAQNLPSLLAGYATRYAATLLITSYISKTNRHSQENGQIIIVDSTLNNFLQQFAFISTRKSSGDYIKVFTGGSDKHSIGQILQSNFDAAKPYREFVSLLEVIHAFKDEDGHGISDAVFRSAKKQGKALIGNSLQESYDAITPLYNQYNVMLNDPFYQKPDNLRRKSEYQIEANKKVVAKTFSAQQFPFSSVATINSLIVVSAKLLKQTAAESTNNADSVSFLNNVLTTLESKKQEMLNEEAYLEQYHKQVKTEVENKRAQSPKKEKASSSKKGSLGQVMHFQKPEPNFMVSNPF